MLTEQWYTWAQEEMRWGSVTKGGNKTQRETVKKVEKQKARKAAEWGQNEGASKCETMCESKKNDWLDGAWTGA